MGILFITDEDEAKINRIIVEARNQTVPRFIVDEIGIEPVDKLTYEQIKASVGGVPASHAITLGNYRAAFSFEDQPNGLVRHLSVSVDTASKGNVPQPMVLEIIAKTFGFTEFPPRAGKVWMEEYRPGEWAVNVIELVDAKLPKENDDIQPESEKSAVA